MTKHRRRTMEEDFLKVIYFESEKWLKKRLKRNQNSGKLNLQLKHLKISFFQNFILLNYQSMKPIASKSKKLPKTIHKP